MPRSTGFPRLAVLLALLMLAACGAQPPAASQSATASTSPTAPAAVTEPTASGNAASAQDTVVYANDLSDTISFDPAVAYETGSLVVAANLYETLVKIDPGDPTIKPSLAKSWVISDTNDTWTLTFALDPNAKFASGNPVTADDVIYSWSRVIALNKSPAFLLIDIAQITKDSLKAINPQTLEVKLPKAVGPQAFLSILSNTVTGVLDKQALAANLGSDQGSTWLNDHSAGSGAYVLDTWERGSQVSLNANPAYWGAAPKNKRVILRNVTELANIQSAIETGEADIVGSLGAEQAKALEANADVQQIKADSLLLIYLGFNATVAPLDKPEVREAIRYAINYDEIANNLLGGNGKVVQEIIPAGLAGHTGETPFKPDIAKAKDLLAKAGVAPNTEIELLVPIGTAPGGIDNATLAAKIQSDVAQIGLKLNIKQIQSSEFFTAYRAQKTQVVLISWGPDFPDPDANVTPLTNYAAKSIAWRNAWNAPDIAKLSQQAAQETDTTKRNELYKQITERVLHEGPYAVLYQPSSIYATRKNIAGFAVNSLSTPSHQLRDDQQELVHLERRV